MRSIAREGEGVGERAKKKERTMKRFYNNVAIDKKTDGYEVLLDERSIKTPSKKTVLLPHKALAEAVAQEWRDQGDKIDMPSMVLTRLCYGVLELDDADRAMLREESLEYITTELLCYRDAEHPELYKMQCEQWDTHLEWARDALGIALESTTAITPVPISKAATEAAHRIINTLDDWHLVPFALLVRLSGSLIVSLAVLYGRVSAAEAMRLSQLEQDFQAKQWGLDMDTEARRASALREAEAVSMFFNLLNNSDYK